MNPNSQMLANKYHRLKIVAYFLLLLLALSSQSLQAHPHSWIDMKTEVVGSKKQITGLKMSWTFDAMTSSYMLDGEDLSADNKQYALQKMAKTIMDNMSVEHYFTYLYEGENPVKYSLAKQGILTQNKAKLTLDFYLPLSKPKEISGLALKLLIFEPSYYVDMSWQNKEDIQLSSKLDPRCTLQLNEAAPTPEQVTYAMSLPADAQSDNALGQLFTQNVLISCPAAEE